jgi:hypothetical protein
MLGNGIINALIFPILRNIARIGSAPHIAILGKPHDTELPLFGALCQKPQKPLRQPDQSISFSLPLSAYFRKNAHGTLYSGFLSRCYSHPKIGLAMRLEEFFLPMTVRPQHHLF